MRTKEKRKVKKINDTVEQIFAIAVALNQSGGLKNTIYAIDNEIYILNYDHTVLLRFLTAKSEVVFDDPVSFRADDYDSNQFEQKGNKIIFYSKEGEWERKKTSGVSDLTPEEVQNLFAELYPDEIEEGVWARAEIDSRVLNLLDEELSHTEFTGEKGESVKLTQRNIYSGELIEIERHNEGLLKVVMKNDFGPIAIKTGDFRALFQFHTLLNFYFPHGENEDYILVKNIETGSSGRVGGGRKIAGVIAGCLYDEIIHLKEVNHGRKKPQIRRSK